ncbi:MAG: cell surface protein SprA [Bacteroidetes bacterium SB0662_bin_6]|nr:cell surface protein SprA [Bacteroidetes bacterium SB0668_bin_1]MYE04425.1 cell surface protein SprA [Bacteroidetes bacterium SB0662_bin_6]
MDAPRAHAAGAIIMAVLLQGMAAHYGSAQVSPPPKDDTVSDTDAPTFGMIFFNRTATADPDTLTFEMIFGNAAERADTTDTTAYRRADFYLPSTQPDRRMASPVQRARRPFFPALGNYWRHEVELDSTRKEFIVREFVGESEVRYPLVIDFESYRERRLNAWLSDNWRIISEQKAQQRRQRTRGGIGFNIAIPGGRQSAFSTIFGANTVSLRVNGQASIQAGFDYRKSDQQVAVTGRSGQLSPEFNQDIRLGITGSIGDKLDIDVDWDTQNQFEFQNQLRLQYTGYEDEIIRNIEAGNVNLSTPSRLIRGGQSLFGIKSEFQLGGWHLTTVASQQEGQTNSLSIEGGAQTTEFDMKPTEYNDNTHYFLAYYFRNRWEDALQSPPQILVANGFESITDIEVWKLERTSAEEENVRQAVALVDLGEPQDVVRLANGYTAQTLPGTDVWRYPQAALDAEVRNGEAKPQDYLASLGLGDDDFQVGKFKKLRPGSDFDFDNVLGYISLRQRMQENEALAVAFRFRANGQTYQVGDFSSETGGASGGQNSDRLVLKLLKPVQLRQPNPEGDFNPAAWYLELRNIYRIPGRGLNPNDFELQVEYQPPGSPAATVIPELNGAKRQTLLQLLGLDRLNTDLAERPDDIFDYLVNFTINPSKGELIFPWLEPFGSHIEDVIDGLDIPESQKQARKNKFAYAGLYTQKKELAARQSQFDVYRIRGSYRGAVQDFYDLRAFSGLIEGSVNVTSGGSRLTEGTDFIVDYQGGTVTIINDAYLIGGRAIEIDYEQNSYFNIQKKTLLGARLDYVVSDELAFGSTMFRLNQKSPIDKYRVGEEPISNTIWGLDGQLNIEPLWLTRAVDAIPLIQTRAPSHIRVSGEFAQLRPGANPTTAFERSRRNLRKLGQDFEGDELRGISYLDDFEGFENTYSLRQAGGWHLASAPDSISVYPADFSGFTADSLRTNWRAVLGWYSLHQNTLEDLIGKNTKCDSVDPAICPVRINEVLPNKDVSKESHPFIQPLDVYFTPHQRGPYNYTRDLKGFLDEPRNTWGGMVQRLPEGYTDFSTKNIEFIEFIVKVYPERGGRVHRDAKLFVDLGSISEDIIPNGLLNTEDGLTLASVSVRDLDSWSRTASGTQNITIDVDGQRTEDLGLDGLASYSPSDYDDLVTEQAHFSNFLDALDDGVSDPRYRAEAAKARLDPSGDDFFYFGANEYFENPVYYPGGASVQERFSRYFPSTEINSFEAQKELAPSLYGNRGNSRLPDTEDLNINSAADTDNSYFQYQLPLAPAALDSLARPERTNDYVVTEIAPGGGWYQIRIPVRDFTRRVGNIQDFSLIESIRVWTTGHDNPVTLRFPTFELVGAQWQKSEAVISERSLPADILRDQTRLSVSSINNEENSTTYATPNGTIISQIRTTAGELQNAREQAMALRVENLTPGKQQAIFKTYNQEVDLLKYSNLRMFLHMHGERGDGAPIEERDNVRFFLRLGANETNDYYEYEMPLSPSSIASRDADELWQTSRMVGGELIDLNSVNIKLGALNQLKVSRDDRAFATDSVYWSDIHDVPLSPGIAEFAPPGTRLGVKGRPSLGGINTIVLGIRNTADSTIAGVRNSRPEDILGDVTVWVNELRVSGYDETNGWAAIGNADIKLADFATLRASWKHQTDGFGGLESTLGDREQDKISNWSVTTDVNLDKFIPEKYGWTLPASVQVSNQTTTPRFSPNRGDIRLEELLTQTDRNDELTEAEREQKKDEIIEAAQTRSVTRSYSIRVGKSGSDSRVLRNTLDGIAFSFSSSDAAASNPSQRKRDNQRWNSSLTYRVNVRRPRTVRPFWFLGDIPVLRTLGGLNFNYAPRAVTAGATAARNFSVSQDRRRELPDPMAEFLPELVEFPLRQSHALSHRRNGNLQYDPFQFLNVSYTASTSQSLNAAGVDTVFTVIRVDSLSNESFFANTTEAEALASGLINENDTRYEISELRLVRAGQVLNRIFSGHEGVRTDQHNEQFTATFNPRMPASLDWFNIQNITWSSQFSWRNGSVGRNTGASASNQSQVSGSNTIHLQDLFRKIPFYEVMEQAENQYRQEKEAERAQRRQERAAAREERRAIREAEREERRRLEQEEEERREREKAAAEAAEEEGTGEGEEDDAIQEEEEALLETEEMPLEGEEALPTPEVLPVEEEDTPPAGELELTGEAEEETPGDENIEVEAEEEDSGPNFFTTLLPNPASIARRTLLAITGIRELTITYRSNQGSNSSNVGRLLLDDNDNILGVDAPYSLVDAIFNNEGPPLGYRFGLERDLPLEQRIISDRIQVRDALTAQQQIQGRTTLNPTQSLQINLTWNANWTNSTNRTYRPDPITITETFTGSNRASVWVFGPGYLDMFARQLETYQQDDARAADSRRIGDENGDGRIVLTNESIVTDFQDAFLSGLGTVDSRGFLPFPMPGWQISWSGIGQWPIIRNLVTNASIRHGYSSDYATDYRRNVISSDSTRAFALSGQQIVFTIPEDEIGSLRVNERFQPLIGLDLSFKGNLQTSITWEKSTSYVLSTTNFEVSENNNSQITMTANYSRSGMKLPFLKRINNRISFSLTMSVANLSDRRFLLRRALTDYIDRRQEFRVDDALEGDNVSVISASKRYTVAPRISYQISNRVSTDFTLRYENFISEDSRTPSSTNINGGVNFRLSIAN